MFEVAPWKSTTRRMPGAGFGGMWTISSRASPSTVIWCSAVPGAKPWPSTQRVATAVVVEVAAVVVAAVVEVVELAAFGELGLHAASARNAVAQASAADGRRNAVTPTNRARRRPRRWFRD